MGKWAVSADHNTLLATNLCQARPGLSLSRGQMMFYRHSDPTLTASCGLASSSSHYLPDIGTDTDIAHWDKMTPPHRHRHCTLGQNDPPDSQVIIGHMLSPQLPRWCHQDTPDIMSAGDIGEIGNFLGLDTELWNILATWRDAMENI